MFGMNAIASSMCMSRNSKGDAYFNCGAENNNWEGPYKKCKTSDAMCGKVGVYKNFYQTIRQNSS